MGLGLSPCQAKPLPPSTDDNTAGLQHQKGTTLQESHPHSRSPHPEASANDLAIHAGPLPSDSPFFFNGRPHGIWKLPGWGSNLSHRHCGES